MSKGPLYRNSGLGEVLLTAVKSAFCKQTLKPSEGAVELLSCFWRLNSVIGSPIDGLGEPPSELGRAVQVYVGTHALTI